MQTPRRQRLVLVTVALCVIATACGSDKPKATGATAPPVVKDVPKQWSAQGIQDLKDLAGRLAKSDAKFCADLGITSTDDYRLSLTTLQKAKEIPESIGSCTAGEESLEIAIFSDNKHRDTFIEERRWILCSLSRQRNVGFPGLRFAVGDSWTIQPDSQTVALDIAEVLDGDYKVAPCPEVKDTDWDRGAVDTIRDLAKKLNAAGYKCPFAVDDKDLARNERRYVEIGLPGALGSCDADFGALGAPTFGLVAFAQGSTPADVFIPNQLQELCSGGADVRHIRGSNWVAFVVGEKIADVVADVLDGKVSETRCPPLPTTTKGSSTTAPGATSTPSTKETKP